LLALAAAGEWLIGRSDGPHVGFLDLLIFMAIAMGLVGLTTLRKSRSAKELKFTPKGIEP
jgi:hypothetical protein